MAHYMGAEEITPIMAEYVADVFSRKEHLDNISYGYCMEISDVFRRYTERAKQEQPEVDLENEISRWITEDCGPSDFNAFADHWCADDIIATARHFYELGLNARKEDKR